MKVKITYIIMRPNYLTITWLNLLMVLYTYYLLVPGVKLVFLFC